MFKGLPTFTMYLQLTAIVGIVVFFLNACGSDNDISGSRSDNRAINGKLVTQLSVTSFDMKQGFKTSASNYIITDGVAYDLVFSQKTNFRLERSSGSESFAVAVPTTDGVKQIRLYPGAIYSIRGVEEDTQDYFGDDKIKIKRINLEHFEFINPAK